MLVVAVLGRLRRTLGWIATTVPLPVSWRELLLKWELSPLLRPWGEGETPLHLRFLNAITFIKYSTQNRK